MDKIITSLPKEKLDETLFFIPHLGLGDQIVNNGLVNIFLEKFKNVILVVKEPNLESLKNMYSYTNKIIFYTVQHDMEISPRYGFDINKFLDIIKESGFYFFLQSSHRIVSSPQLLGNCFSKSFYLEIGLDPSLRYDKFKMERNFEKEMDYYNRFIKLYGKDYIIIHQDKSRGFLLDETKISSNSKNSSAARYYIGETDSFKLDNLFDFGIIFEKSSELHLMPSSISIYCDHLNLTGELFIHFYSRILEWKNQDIKELYKYKNINIIY